MMMMMMMIIIIIKEKHVWCKIKIYTYKKLLLTSFDATSHRQVIHSIQMYKKSYLTISCLFIEPSFSI